MEIRSLWVARWDLTDPAGCSRVVQLAKDNNFNTLVVQVRGRGDAFYNSHCEPRAEELADHPGFDPLAQLLEDGHAAGLHVHAWINANLTWGSVRPPVSPEHIVNKHPDWLMRTDENKIVTTFGRDVEGAYTCPSNEQWRAMHTDIYLDVVNQYDVDGVQFDFIRYPSSRFCHCDRCLAKFRTQVEDGLTAARRAELAESADRLAYTREFASEWDDFRREQITRMVYSVYDAVKKAKPAVAVSASVFPDFADAYNHRFQDWKKWMQDKKVDCLYSMAYTNDPEQWSAEIRDAVSSSGGIPVCAGIGAWQISADDCLRNIEAGRELGAAGFSLFSYSITNKGADDTYLKALKDK